MCPGSDSGVNVGDVVHVSHAVSHLPRSMWSPVDKDSLQTNIRENLLIFGGLYRLNKTHDS